MDKTNKRDGGMPDGETPEGPLPVSDAHLTGFGATKQDMQRGYLRDNSESDMDYFGPSNGGFAGRPQGWER